MKVTRFDKSMTYALPLIGALFALASSAGNAGSMGAVQPTELQKFYVGVFGGGGTSTKVHVSQYGTAFYTEAYGGPLAVDAFGKTNPRSVGLAGAHVGYQWAELFLNPLNSQWGITPAIELEGYYLGKSKFTAHDINNDTARLPEHNFAVSYPMKSGVFLTNAVINFNPPNQSRLMPYIAAGIGAAVTSISNATSTQVTPPEPGINHYNSNNDDSDAMFAAQTKVGLNLSLFKNTSLFAEYRWLYLSSSHYSFGSTVYPTHAPTSNWLTKMNAQKYNMGAVGIRYYI